MGYKHDFQLCFRHPGANHIWASYLTFLNQFAPLKLAVREITLLKIWLRGKPSMNDFKVFSEYKMSHKVQLPRKRLNFYRCMFPFLIIICYSDYREKPLID